MVDKYQKITVGGLLIKNNKALVVRRSKTEETFQGYYELPGGKVDFGDNPEEALKREFIEEVNLKIKVIRSYRIFDYISHEGKRHTIEIVYLVELKDNIDNIKLSHEHDDFKWVSLEELDSLNATKEIKINIREGFKLK